ncbi:DUF7511 domain-containing protein [Halopelagius longus]|uniref:DUF7511 domain-containing protein n=1 Tax=Halopelagius longus TaxID=1236180 RepID=A0A1H1B178_9EURY|nr:hypothetical protein [Halopelagius longus]RDI70601.1 hypothetical protein DWB78_02045 [Halopelagius longus]SDQ45715.1 hypothetical protein SAMN05216278_1589 [Halopelagius longus]
MSDSSADSTWTPESRSADEAVGDRAIDGRDFALHSVVVRYDGRPDRCTLYPRRESCRDRMQSWLTANQDAFVGLEEYR